MRMFIVALSFLLLLPAAAIADAGDQAAVRAAQDYLNAIVTLKARFVQTANDGTQASGDFMLKRPGRMRFQYDKPLTDFIVADGITIFYYDGQLKQQSSAPISKSIADFFLRKNLTLSGDVRVSDVQHDHGQLLLTLVQAEDPLSGSLMLYFSEKPMQLNKWRVVDGQGLTTEVALSEVVTGITLANDLFHYYDPQHSHPKYN